MGRRPKMRQRTARWCGQLYDHLADLARAGAPLPTLRTIAASIGIEVYSAGHCLDLLRLGGRLTVTRGARKCILRITLDSGAVLSSPQDRGAPIAATPTQAQAAQLPPSRSVEYASLLIRPARICQWRADDEPRCERPSEPRSSYCAEHHARAHVAGSAQKQAGAGSAFDVISSKADRQFAGRFR